MKEVIPKGESEVLTSKHLKPQGYFFYVGNVYPHKNIKLAIQAIVKLNENIGDKITFAIAGSKDLFTERLQKEIVSLKAEKFVKVGCDICWQSV